MRTRIVLKEKDLDFERIIIDLPNKEQKQPWFLALNPYGKVPVLVEEDAWVVESALCNEYLEEQYPTPRLAPTDGRAKAEMRLWVEFCNSQFVPPVLSMLYEQRKPAAEQSADKMRHQQEKLTGLLPQLEQQLNGRDYLMGEHGIADLTFTPFLTLAERAGVDFGSFPNVDGLASAAETAAQLRRSEDRLCGLIGCVPAARINATVLSPPPVPCPSLSTSDHSSEQAPQVAGGLRAGGAQPRPAVRPVCRGSDGQALSGLCGRGHGRD